jgi:EAL domain-containing protein (putative c-di-GMP-specific phosphodiesterase class I)
LTLLVLECALEQCARWRADGHDIGVAVNLSVRNLLDAELPDDVVRLLARFGLPASALELEITETALVADAARTYAALQRLHELGVGISIDDFGTGYSSLSYLRHMPVDVLKIDKSFIDEILHSAEQLALVEAIVNLARTLRLAVVAEGIEHPAHRFRLIELGCPYGQGYLFSKPVSAAEIAHAMRSPASVS